MDPLSVRCVASQVSVLMDVEVVTVFFAPGLFTRSVALSFVARQTSWMYLAFATRNRKSTEIG